MLISDFDFPLPEELIAQRPLAERDASRMLVVDRANQGWRDAQFSDLPSELAAGDLLVVNDTRVFPARLAGRREPSGGQVELLLIEEREPLVWEALARPARRLARGQEVSFGRGRLRAEVIEERADGRRALRFHCDPADFFALVEELGRAPLPPYIKREKAEEGGARAAEDLARYQTVYAASRGAIAAPTAGLHFTPRVFDGLRARGVSVAKITLHVGYGTFAPVRVEDLSGHEVEPERFEISDEAARAINEARAGGRRVVAVGTTSVRALESAADAQGRVRAGRGLARLTVTPGYEFRTVGALVTNFHLPRSSLLVLVSSFAGRGLTLAAYRHAVAARYRFYSYGDCMLIK
ncbi:MAG TPA: tRNA preQ1(34) S-adenosylmethionine ribosyltransferase-isomerase QueA [Pyrinomonadaceae bacterium]|nr:tRNA preQ1(34) S-adenosylmethionine ribosyltransferase-isomerase QueA [Pyrinomonadaceae bacterium]